jgi:hypothetical protein
MTQLSTPHSYEELRGVIIDILLKREIVGYEPSQYTSLVTGVAEVLARRGAGGERIQMSSSPSEVRLHPQDVELIRDVFWDLFRQGFITLGFNNNNPNWPWFRLSHFGEKTLQTQSPYRFHDTGSFIVMVKKEVPDISPEAVLYLDEAVAAFYADCLLASCVMLGVAAEAEFLRLLDVAAKNTTHGSKFAQATKQPFIRQKITKFHDSVKPLLPSLPQTAAEDFDTNFAMIQSMLRIARNEAGHPAAIQLTLQREQVYVYLQLFVPFARQLMRLRVALM